MLNNLALTGGQPLDGLLRSPVSIVSGMHDELVRRARRPKGGIR